MIHKKEKCHTGPKGPKKVSHIIWMAPTTATAEATTTAASTSSTAKQLQIVR